MSILELLFLNKSESYESFMKRIESIFKNVNLEHLLNQQATSLQWLLPDFMKKDTDVKQKYIKTCCNLIANAINKAQDRVGKNDYDLDDIDKFLSFESRAMADERLLSGFYLQSNFVLTLLQLSFFALVYTDFKTRRRFEMAYKLWRNSIEFAFAGYVPEIERMLPFYLTYYEKSAFIVNPITGKIHKFLKKGGLRNITIKDLIIDGTKSTGIIYALTSRGERVPLIEYNDFGYREISPTDIVSKDMKKSERMKADDYIETMWLTTGICSCENEIGKISSYYLSDHLFVGLMVFGLEIMKFVIMEGRSILTLHHIDGVYFRNSVCNLAVLSRFQNIQEEYGNGDFYFNFYEYFSNCLEVAKRIQDDYDFRKRC